MVVGVVVAVGAASADFREVRRIRPCDWHFAHVWWPIGLN